jgi:organic radical activating enzyme
LQSILSLVELESGGKPVKVDGFRLKNIEGWAESSIVPSDILLQASSGCDLDCIFCYNQAGFRSLAWAKHISHEDEMHELETRLKYYNPAAARGVFPTFGNPCEFMTDPNALDLLTKLRGKTPAPFRICTNGTRLEEDLIARLAELSPIHLDISLNSASPERRSMLMRDDRPETAIASLGLLRKHGISYCVTVVVWPLPSLQAALDDLEQTAAFATANSACLLQINLPGFTKLQFAEPPFDSDEVWRSTVERVQELREQIACPIVIKPSLYEENMTRCKKNLAEIIGTVEGSPAALSGLRNGDFLRKINGVPVRDRAQARDLLSIIANNGGGNVSLVVKRSGRELELEMNPANYIYPFNRHSVAHFGAVFMGSGFRESCLERMREILLKHKPREALLLSSHLVRPTLEQMLAENPFYVPEGTQLRIEVPENSSFGGNIIMGDLLLVQDFIDCIQRYLNTASRPDLILIPSSPFYSSGWKRDLSGRPYLDIERQVAIPVSLIECDPIWD